MPYTSITKKMLDCGDYPAALKKAAEMVDLVEDGIALDQHVTFIEHEHWNANYRIQGPHLIRLLEDVEDLQLERDLEHV